MSTTIGIGFRCDKKSELSIAIEDIALTYGYGVEQNPDMAEPDMREGLKAMIDSLNLNNVILLKTPANSPTPLAFDIDLELGNWECERKRPKFFDFLLAISLLLKGNTQAFYVFFSGEWERNDRVRFDEGHIEELLHFLRRPAHWQERLFIPQTGRLQYSDEKPLVYKVLT